MRLPNLPGAEAARETPPLERRRWEWSAIQTDEYAHKHPFQFVAVEAAVTAPVTTVAVGAASGLGWGLLALIAAVASLASIFLVFLGMRAVYWLRAQGQQLGAVRTELAETVESGQRSIGRLEARIAELEAPTLVSSEPEGPPVWGEMKPRIQEYLEQARDYFRELRGGTQPDRTAELYDEIRTWAEAVENDLYRYHATSASDFRRGGSILSPQIGTIAPTDHATLTIYVLRRGHILRNLLDNTPGKGLYDDEGDLF